jgi:hypothetical protein
VNCLSGKEKQEKSGPARNFGGRTAGNLVFGFNEQAVAQIESELP